jgi:predicted porin
LKKHLLSTSAIALGVAMASPAAAQQWDLDWGGFANTHVGASDISGSGVGENQDFDGVNVHTNSELVFSPNVTLDNGLTFGFSVQIEMLNQTTTVNTDQATGSNSYIDESYVTIEGDTLGKIVLGSENSAGYLMMVGAPQVGSMPINSGSQSAFIPFVDGGIDNGLTASRSSFTEVARNNDVQRMTYFTPSFSGLVVGFSYAPSNAGNASRNAAVDFDAGGDVTDIFDIGASYDQSFGNIDLSLAARWGTGDRNGTDDVEGGDPTTWAIGGSITVDAFTFGAAYAENDNDAAGGADNSEGVSVGAAYDLVGPWTIGLEGYFGELKNARFADDDMDVYKLAASRELGAGVSWDVYYMYQETKNGITNEKIEGNVIATAINLSF